LGRHAQAFDGASKKAGSDESRQRQKQKAHCPLDEDFERIPLYTTVAHSKLKFWAKDFHENSI